MVAAGMVVFIAVVGLVVDVGRLYVAQRQLQIAADAAALAGAQSLPNGTAARTVACTYSATDHGGGSCDGATMGTDAKNAVGSLPGVETATTLECLSATSAGAGCVTGDGCDTNPLPPSYASGGGCNAIKVTETIQLPTTFMRVLGINSMPITVSSTAGAAGGTPHPLDIQMVVDTSGSMRDHCAAKVPGIPSTSTLPTKLDCANAGVRALLQNLLPCSQTQLACQGDPANPLNVFNPIDRVGLMIFPAMKIAPSSGSLARDPNNVVTSETNCADDVTSSNLTYSTTSSTNQVVPLSGDYRTSDTATSLNPNSSLSQAVWWKNCPGQVYPIGGGGSSSSIVGGGTGDQSQASNGSGLAGGPGSGGNQTGATNGAGIGGGPASTPNRTGAAASSAIAGGPGGSSNRSGATNGPGIRVGLANGTANDRSVAANSGSIGAGDSAAGDRSSQTVGSAASITLTRPANAANGDFQLAVVTAQNAVGKNDDICAPAGWTLVDEQTTGNSRTDPRVVQAVFWGAGAATTPTTYTFTVRTACTGGSDETGNAISGILVRYTGVDTTNPIDAADGQTGQDSSPKAPSITVSSAQDRIVRLFGTGSTTLTTGTTYSTASTSTATGVTESTPPPAAGGTTGTASASSGNDMWVAQTVALQDTRSSIVVQRPADAASGDFLLASVTAQGLGGGNICAPNDGSWTLVRKTTQGSGATSLTQSTFWSVRGTANPESYSFAFTSGNCPATGSPVAGIPASAVLLRYTGVDPADPIDISGDAAGSGTTATAPSVNVGTVGDTVVRLFGTTSATATPTDALRFSENGSATTTALGEDGTSPAAGAASGSSGASLGSTPAGWTAQTVALQDARSSIMVQRPANAVAGDFLLVSVTAEGLGAGNVCAPNDGTWTLVRKTTKAAGGGLPSLTQATFSSFRTTANAESYSFTFRSGTCPNNGSTVDGIPASAVVLRYTGVDPNDPIDQVGDAPGSGGTLSTASVPTGSGNERVVWLYGTGATSISSYSPAAASSFTATGSSTATGAADLSQPTAGPTASGAQAVAPSAPWGAQVITLQSPPATLTIARPGNAAAGDFLLATVTAQGVGTGHICAPNDGTWTRVADTGQGSLHQATFSSVRATAGAENYTFTFRSGNCPSSGTALTGISASAVVVRYTGVDAVTPFDDKKTAVGPDPNPGTTLDAPAVTTSQLNDRIVDIYGTSATSFSGGTTFAQPGSSTATGISDVSQAPAKLEPAPLPTATSGASGDWIVQAFALRDTRAELTIARPSNVADNDLLLVSVTATGLGSAGQICAPDSSWKAVGAPVIANPIPAPARSPRRPSEASGWAPIPRRTRSRSRRAPAAPAPTRTRPRPPSPCATRGSIRPARSTTSSPQPRRRRVGRRRRRPPPPVRRTSALSASTGRPRPRSRAVRRSTSRARAQRPARSTTDRLRPPEPFPPTALPLRARGGSRRRSC